MHQPMWIRTYRVAFAVLAFAAIVGKYYHGTDAFPDFLSLFTVHSNAYAALVLLLGALVSQPVTNGRGWDLARGAAVMFMVTITSDRHWTHTVLHQVMPVVIVADLLILPLRHRLAWRDIGLWMIYPVAYLTYSLARGPLVGWYPYDFIDPDEQGGYDGVALYTLGITAGFLLVALLVVIFSKWRLRQATEPPASRPEPDTGPARLTRA
jgi:hypothetical protein